MVTEDYKALDYPLDLWIDWNSRMFDQLSLVTYGHIDLPSKPNLIVTELAASRRDNFEFYRLAKKEAQSRLSTDWKADLDVDEFVPAKIPVSELDSRLTYAFEMRHLYGNLETEIQGYFPAYYFRLHYGERRVLMDGGAVAGPYAAKILYSRAWRYPFWRFLRLGTYVSPLRPTRAFEVFHTGACRKPESLSTKWTRQIQIEVRQGRKQNADRLSLLKGGFDYHSFKGLNPASRLTRIRDDRLPAVLKANHARFTHVSFSDDEYAAA